MNRLDRPLSVSIVACIYLAVGSIGFLYHSRELLAPGHGGFLVELVELLAVISGTFMLRGQNWARWLAVAWMGFHVLISFPAISQVVIHSLFFAGIAWVLFRSAANRYFRAMA